ncbi:cysteine/glutathione ABC transporter ATP-binding protein/permease CydC [Erwinia tracheiphila]|uniref:Glutathione/L-cysteine transport system ATP-binding/permease protein CydC n=1 Tax=Erwinia tracheiphila TaxID=65700 RepID=A0A0M2KDF1_9GAMM|nr:cysteine/glutathione ABC transporter ATP-binding protein/permease CydC [Erwinia tracheiphila]EOS96530.1 cysteine/glutathione ABC transporter membrane/ATP-binding component [Erwinia tracheiphila PSU-1]KKF34986.1 amino acid ABC transporter permease [Erwinia tracheiphila]UIA86652.1 cysteine/glutathione ABC transporter ATP-binding protein/permease CydC [Erwinia tracheiphila]UIA95007.1 cysteine/glutathione ABC transporter ATP-binding protein/permease CydC [Erwinia tracheiphila]
MKILRPFLALYRRHFWRLTLGVVLAMITLLASIGLLTLSGWFLAASSLAGMAGLFSFNYMLPAAGVRGAAIVRTAARYFERLVSHDATFRVLEHLRVFSFSKLFPLSPAKLTDFRRTDLLNRLVADVDTLDHLYLRILSPFVCALIVILAITAGLSFLDWQLALLLGGILTLTLLLLPLLFYRPGLSAGQTLTALRAQYRAQLTDWLQSQTELKLYGAAQRFRNDLRMTEAKWQNVQRTQSSLTGLSQALLLLITGTSVVLVFWLSAGGIGNETHPGALIALFVFCALAAFEAIAPVGGAFLHLGQVIASAERLTQIINQPPAVIFPTRQQGGVTTPALSIHNVNFSYPNGRSVLNDVSLDVSAGEHIALLGRTGCGKSTLLQLLTRAWDVDSGDIVIHGQPLKKWDEASLRSMTSVVTQRVYLFSGTLRQNLCLAASESSDEQLTDVLYQVGLDGLLLDGQGLNNWLGEGGRQLSGGELRRLGLARALLHGGSLLLLDEPTEGLDAETERQILTLLHEVAKNKTLIMVTHRLRGLAHFDRICVMEEGCLVEQGKHHDLIAKRGCYWYSHQQFTL